MVKTPRTRHSSSGRDPVTIELGPDVHAGSVDAVLVYSANAAALLAARVQGLETATFVCISPRVAEVLARPGGKILAAGEPNETALLKLLGEAVKPAS